MTEGEATRKLCERWRDRGWFAAVIAGGVRYQRVGMPDRLLVSPDGAVLLEFKAYKGIVSVDQRVCLADIRRVDPCSAFVARFSPTWTALMLETERGEELAVCDATSPDDIREGLRIASAIVARRPNAT